MSTTPNSPREPRSAVPEQPSDGQPLGQGAVNGAPQGLPNGQQYGQNPANGTPAGQQYGRAGGKYGTAEYNPGQYTGTVERPATIDRLLKLTLLSLGVYVLNGIVGFLLSANVDYVEMFKNRGMSTEMATDAADRAAGFGGPGGSIVILLVMVGLYALVYTFVRKGKNWARILGTVFAALAIVSGLVGLLGAFIYPAPWNIILIVLMVAKLIVDILWIVTAFKAPTSAWFNQNRVQR